MLSGDMPSCPIPSCFMEQQTPDHSELSGQGTETRDVRCRSCQQVQHSCKHVDAKHMLQWHNASLEAWKPRGLECTALSSWAQSLDGLTRACPVVVIRVMPPSRQQAFLFHFSFSFSFFPVAWGAGLVSLQPYHTADHLAPTE